MRFVEQLQQLNTTRQGVSRRVQQTSTISAQKGQCFSSRKFEIKMPQICDVFCQSSSGFLHTVFKFEAAAKTWQTSQNRDIYNGIQNSSTIRSVIFFLTGEYQTPHVVLAKKRYFMTIFTNFSSLKSSIFVISLITQLIVRTIIIFQSALPWALLTKQLIQNSLSL